MMMYKIVGAAMHVHEVLGRGLEEAVYQEALEMELGKRNLPYESQKLINCYYEGEKMRKFYVADFYCKGLIIEIKSTESICSEHRSQLFNYMRLTHTKRGLLVNFGEKSLRCERYIYMEETDDFRLINKDNLSSYVTPV